ncbi:hypothetical protein SprV_0802466000 [Sparganum proliferum]
MEMSSCAEGSLEATSIGQSDGEQPKRSDVVVHACRLTHKLYTIEEVSEDEEEEEEEGEEEEDEDVEDREDMEEGEKPTNDGLGKADNEELGKITTEQEREEEKSERKVAASEEQVEARREEEETREIKEATEETRDIVEEDGEREMMESRQDVMLYFAKQSDAPQKNMKVEEVLANPQGRHTAGEAVSASADVSRKLTRAEKWAMRRHVGQWRNACASTVCPASACSSLAGSLRSLFSSSFSLTSFGCACSSSFPSPSSPYLGFFTFILVFSVLDIVVFVTNKLPIVPIDSSQSFNHNTENSANVWALCTSADDACYPVVHLLHFIKTPNQSTYAFNTLPSTRKYTPKLYIIEEVSKEQEEEEEFADIEDVKEEEDD